MNSWNSPTNTTVGISLNFTDFGLGPTHTQRREYFHATILCVECPLEDKACPSATHLYSPLHYPSLIKNLVLLSLKPSLWEASVSPRMSNDKLCYLGGGGERPSSCPRYYSNEIIHGSATNNRHKENWHTPKRAQGRFSDLILWSGKCKLPPSKQPLHTVSTVYASFTRGSLLAASKSQKYSPFLWDLQEPSTITFATRLTRRLHRTLL